MTATKRSTALGCAPKNRTSSFKYRVLLVTLLCLGCACPSYAQWSDHVGILSVPCESDSNAVEDWLAQCDDNGWNCAVEGISPASEDCRTPAFNRAWQAPGDACGSGSDLDINEESKMAGCTASDTNLDAPSCDNSVGNPIDMTTGSKYQTATDFEIQPAPYALSLTRFISSNNKMRGPFGPGWSSILDAQFYESVPPENKLTLGEAYRWRPLQFRAPYMGRGSSRGGISYSPATEKSSIILNDGRKFVFERAKNSSQEWRPTMDGYEIEADVATNSFILTVEGETEEYTVDDLEHSRKINAVLPDGRIYAFRRIAHANGNVSWGPYAGSYALQYAEGNTHFILTVEGEDPHIVEELVYPGSVSVFIPSSGTYYFTKYETAAGTFRWDPKTRGTAFDANASLDVYYFKDTERNTYEFGAQGYFRKLSFRNGLEIIAERDEALLPADLLFEPQVYTGLTDSYGNTITFAYDSNSQGLISSATLASVGTMFYDYGPTSHQLLSITFSDKDDKLQAKYKHHYLYAGENLSAIEHEIDGERVRYATWTYDLGGRAISSEHGVPGGGAERVTIAYDSNGTTVTNALGKETIYSMSTVDDKRVINHVEGVQSANCAAANKGYSYDSHGEKQTKTDWNGNVTETERNDRGLVILERRGLGSGLAETASMQQIETEWHETWPLPKLVTYSGKDQSGSWTDYRKVEYSYDTKSRMTMRKETDLKTTTYTVAGRSRKWNYVYSYYPDNSPVVKSLIVKAPRGTMGGSTQASTTYNYDTKGNLTQMQDARGHVVQFANHNARGLPRQITDANGVVTSLSYSALGELAQTSVSTDGGPAITTYDYNDNGQLSDVTLPNGASLSYTYNDAQHLIAVENNFGEWIEYVPSLLNGQWVAATIRDADVNNPVAQLQNRYEDELGRIIALLGSDSQDTGYVYDSNSQLSSVVENGYAGTPSQLTTSYTYDSLNRLKTALDPEPVNGQTSYFYDEQGNLSTVIDANGNSTTYLYDGFGLLLERDSPDTGKSIYGYDAAGNLVSESNGRGVTITTFDNLNRPVRRSTNIANDVITWAYGSNGSSDYRVGRLVRIGDSSGSTVYDYNALGLIIGETKSIKVGNSKLDLQTHYTYDLAGQLASISYPGGRVVNFQRAGGRVGALSMRQTSNASAQSIASNITHRPFGPMESLAFGNQLSLSRAYDTDGRLESSLLSGFPLMSSDPDSKLQSLSYDYDRFNNITGISSSASGGSSQDFGYDTMHRLNAAAGIYGSIDYGYDAIGNRLTREVTLGAETTFEDYSYYSSGSRLDSVTSTVEGQSHARQFDYDAAGNMESDTKGESGTVTRLHYDSHGRLEGAVRTSD